MIYGIDLLSYANILIIFAIWVFDFAIVLG